MTRRGLYEMLDPALPGRSARVFRAVHHAAILLGVATIVLGTMPSMAARHGAGLDAVFAAVLALFTVEYVLRIIAAPEAPWLHAEHPWRARLQWARSGHGVIELLAFLPVVLAFALGMPDARLFGVLWLLKFAPYSEGISVLVRVIRHAREQLVSVLLAFLIVLLSAGALEHVLEREAQPDAFGSIPGALWWTIVTLTTTGYGDAVPATFLGRVLGGLVMISGIVLFALWAGILASTFGDEIRRREFLRTWDLVAKVPFFHEIGAATIADMTRLLRPREAAAGAAIVRRGQPGDCMYFVVEGEVEVQVEPPVVLGEGSFFGEVALVTGAPRNATVVAVRPTILLALDLAEFRDLAARRPELTLAINEEAVRRSGRLG